MKRIITWVIAIASYSLTATAQTVLPYENGFDTPAENDDWIIYRMGIGEDEGSVHMWEPKATPGAVSAPNMLFHDYPVGYGGDELTDDWLVTKEKIDMSSGGKLSMNVWVYAISGSLIAGDTFELYLLKGSKDPSVAEKILIASLGSMFVDSGYIDAPEWKDTADINIPATTEDAYFAFRFTNIFDWFTVGIDDLKITAGTSTDMEVIANGNNSISIYPNPANTHIYWNRIPDQDRYTKGTLLNTAGQVLRSFSVADNGLNIGDIAPGFYVLRIGSAAASFIKK